MKENIALLRWLDTAVSGIRFGPDQRAVRAELYAHLEDRTADLLRIFPDIDPEEAQNRALAGMGDPEELKKELARVHRPWLGRLWMVSRFVLGILAALAVVALCTPDEASKNPLAGGYWGYHHQRYAPPEDPRPDRAELGGYTFQVIEAAYVDYAEDLVSRHDEIVLVLRVSSPRFWERVDPTGVYHALTVTVPDGRRFPMVREQTAPGEEPVVTMEPARWGIFFRDFYICIDIEDWSPGDRAVLDFEFPLGGFTLSAGVAEAVVWE